MGWMAARGGGGSAHWRYGTGMDGSTTNPVTGVAQGFTFTHPAMIADMLRNPDRIGYYYRLARLGMIPGGRWVWSTSVETHFTSSSHNFGLTLTLSRQWVDDVMPYYGDGGKGKGGGGGNENSQYSLFFNGSRLMVVDETNGSVPYSTRATSGKGEHMNNPKSQDVMYFGTIPQGIYTMSNAKWSHLNVVQQAWRLLRKGDWGEYNIPLTPITYLGARNGFYLHGGLFEGSAGCIDAGCNINAIFNYVNRQKVTYLRVRYK